jgi:hypothetical protein
MTAYAHFAIGELFEALRGRSALTRDYLKTHPGDFPVWSASLAAPLGYCSDADYDGTYLSWTTNGYGGRVKELDGKFSVNGDRGVFRFKGGADRPVPDLTYLRFAMEPQLSASAVGRRVDGQLNEFTKVSPTLAESVQISLPVTADGELDYGRMVEVGEKLREVEEAQRNLRLSMDALARSAYVLEVPSPATTLRLGDRERFDISIGKRVLKSEHVEDGVPVYSANALEPFGHVSSPNLTDFSRPSLLWGIDGNFDWNLIPAGQAFATTDHCGRLQLKEGQRLDPEYIFAYLKSIGVRFDRVFRANLRNIGDVTVSIPCEDNGEFSLDRQREMAVEFTARMRAQEESLAVLADVLKARVAIEM